MTLSFADLVAVELVDTVGMSIGAFVVIVVILELIRWRNILVPDNTRNEAWSRKMVADSSLEH